jgi:hypothetical protein
MTNAVGASGLEYTFCTKKMRKDFVWRQVDLQMFS